MGSGNNHNIDWEEGEISSKIIGEIEEKRYEKKGEY